MKEAQKTEPEDVEKKMRQIETFLKKGEMQDALQKIELQWQVRQNAKKSREKDM